MPLFDWVMEWLPATLLLAGFCAMVAFVYFLMVQRSAIAAVRVGFGLALAASFRNRSASWRCWKPMTKSST